MKKQTILTGITLCSLIAMMGYTKDNMDKKDKLIEELKQRTFLLGDNNLDLHMENFVLSDKLEEMTFLYNECKAKLLTLDTLSLEEENPIEETIMRASINPNEINVSEEEYNMICRLVESEIGIGNYEEKKKVASVIRNRFVSDSFPNTWEGVIFQRSGSVYQFAPIKNKSYYKVTVTEETKEAVKDILSNGSVNEATYFRTIKGSSGSWHDRDLKVVDKDRYHKFYVGK